jgi:chemotaxis protein MotB
MSKPQAKVVIRKVVKRHGHAHHGGSWKVAYADFVTAMMAFFMVMWILGMSPEARASIQNYFSNPAGVEGGFSGGPNPLGQGGMSASDGLGRVKLISRVQERQAMSAAGRRIEARLRSADGLREIAAQVEVVMTEQGLRIELVERGRGETFFAFGDATLKPAAAQALGVIASELKTTGQPVVLEGHTDSAPFGRAGYTNWELSADRANAARRALEVSGVGREQVAEVRGYADRRLRAPDTPLSAENRRISILLPFTTAPEAAAPGAGDALPGTPTPHAAPTAA